MPDLPAWITQLSDILGQLEKHEGLVQRIEVENLLGVKPRRAMEIMQAAGATIQGKAAFVEPAALAMRLRAMAPKDWEKREKARLRTYGEKMTQVRQEFIDSPPVFVALPNPAVDALDEYGLKALPSNITLSSRSLEIRFNSFLELRASLAALSRAMGKDYAECEWMIDHPGEKKGAA